MALVAATCRGVAPARLHSSLATCQAPSPAIAPGLLLRPRTSSSTSAYASAYCRTLRSQGLKSSSSRAASAFLGQEQGKEHLGQPGSLAALVHAAAGAAAAQGAGTVVRRRAPCSPCASLFGVGAPEALVIGVVALIVFGPKGLAEVARNLGKTLRTFQPTIREIQEVTREFKDTLQQEIGLDEIRNPPPVSRTTPTPITPITPTTTTTGTALPAGQATATPAAPLAAAAAAGTQTEPKAYSADEMARITEEQIKRAMEANASMNTVSEEARRAAELAAWKGNPPSSSAVSAAPSTPTPVADMSKAQSPAPESVQAQSSSAPKADV